MSELHWVFVWMCYFFLWSVRACFAGSGGAPRGSPTLDLMSLELRHDDLALLLYCSYLLEEDMGMDELRYPIVFSTGYPPPNQQNWTALLMLMNGLR